MLVVSDEYGLLGVPHLSPRYSYIRPRSTFVVGFVRWGLNGCQWLGIILIWLTAVNSATNSVKIGRSSTGSEYYLIAPGWAGRHC